MITITSKKIERVIARRGSTATVVSKPRSVALRVVQGGNLIALGAQADPGDLVAIFESNLN